MHPAKVLYEEPKTEIEINASQRGLSSMRSLGFSKFFISTVTSETYKASILATYAKHHESVSDRSAHGGSGVFADTTETASSSQSSTETEPTCSDQTDETAESESSFASSQSSGYVESGQSDLAEGAKALRRVSQTKSQMTVTSYETKLKRDIKPDSTALSQFIQQLQAEEYTPTESKDSYVSELRSNLSILNYEGKSNGSENKFREYSMFELIDVEDCWATWDYENQSHKLPLSDNISKRLNEHPTSNSIRVSFGKINFNCHRIVLRYAKVFRSLEHKTYQLKAEQHVTAIAFVHFYQFAMGKKPTMAAKYFLDVLKAAEVLKVPALQLHCMRLLDSPLYHECNAFVILRAAKRSSQLGMQLLMLQRIWKFFMPFVATKYFLELEASDLCRFLEADTVGVNSEIEIFYAAVLWLSAKWKKRKGKILERVMRCVRYGLLPPWFTYCLKRRTGIAEVDRVLESNCVAKMIEDGASIAATIGLYFVEPSKFESILSRLLPKVPKQRSWIFDRNCTYHYGAHEKVSEAVDFIVFKDYLKILELAGQNYWRNIQEANDDHLMQTFTQKFSELAWSKMQF